MNISVAFEESSQSFGVSFGEVQSASDGGYELGYKAGYNDGYMLWEHVRNLEKAFEYAVFPPGTHVVLDVPNLSNTVMNYAFRSATGVTHITLRCSNRNMAMNWHSAFSRCFDLVVVDLSEFSTYFKPTTDIFYGCSKLEEIRGELDVSALTSLTLWFTSCNSLREVRFTPGSIHAAVSIPSAVLSDDSIVSIVNGLADLTGSTSVKLTLHTDVLAKLTDEQRSQIKQKNWTV